jgi:hypothetical protein
MSEHDELGAAGTEAVNAAEDNAAEDNAAEADVEAHGLKEVAVTGLSAAAMIVGGGDALAATSPGHASVAAKQAVHKIDAAHKGAALSKDAVLKGAAVHKDATFKGNAVIKLSAEKQAVDPSSRRGRDAS